ncbi:Acetyltransferase (GNAT) domain-containing protein [Sinosporangium album]|uniref:Acetyltransferase (GNAT) domain-containing protein n=1 Tax=Sinosporangium album TaxID=504805 RepID=A0A1G8HF42_9ACTN|nr:GNAT family N-acetyltransferase [Sinosporangium album]SDI05294.1 Acetyltransferase (GNAT) domain-containing protein [Sinosporangium album]
MPDVQITLNDGATALRLFPELFSVYKAGFSRPPHSQTETDFVNFEARAKRQFQQPEFGLMTAHRDGGLVGLCFGYPLPVGTGWWNGLDTPADEDFYAEDGTRTCAVIELVVHPDHQRQGIGRRLLTAFLDSRAETRATLATNPEARSVQQMYERWGWRCLGRKPAGFPTAPRPFFDIYLLDLPVTH